MDGSAYSSSSKPISVGDDEIMRRLPGVKAIKAKGKRIAIVKGEEGMSVKDFQSLWALKEKDFDRKARIKCLLSRKEPLSDIELALKNKLIMEIMSKV